MYAYNASKQLAEKQRCARDARGEYGRAADRQRRAQREPADRIRRCRPRRRTARSSSLVAQRALEARAQGEPLDRLLRIQEIAFQEPPRGVRGSKRWRRDWYRLEGEEPIPEALRIAVISDCVRSAREASPAP